MAFSAGRFKRAGRMLLLNWRFLPKRLGWVASDVIMGGGEYFGKINPKRFGRDHRYERLSERVVYGGYLVRRYPFPGAVSWPPRGRQRAAIKRILAVLVMGLLTGFAAPGKDDLIAQGEQWEQAVSGSVDGAAWCLRQWFAGEIISSRRGELTPVTSSFPTAGGVELVSVTSAGMWQWSIALRRSANGTIAVALARQTGGNPTLGKKYVPQKVRHALADCRAR